MKLLLSCNKVKPYLYRQDDDTFELSSRIKYEDISGYTKYYGLNNGKIVGECDFEVEKIIPINVSDDDYDYGVYSGKDLLKESCLSNYDIYEYLQDDNGEEIFKKGYAIHIKNLKIFDKPRELYECLIHPKIEHRYYGCEHLSKAPQNMMYVELDDIKHVLISISPQEMCRILNKEQTIIVRKKVLKEMTQ